MPWELVISRPNISCAIQNNSTLSSHFLAQKKFQLEEVSLVSYMLDFP